MTDPAPPGQKPRLLPDLRRGGVFLAIAAVLVLLAVVPEFRSRTLPDTGWLLYAAARMLDGATLYTDLVEVNPPLIVWLNAIPVGLSGVTGLSPILVYRLLVLLAVAVSVIASAHLMERGMPGAPREEVRLVVLLLLFGTLTLAREDYGEREHLLLALGCPYILLTWLRAEALRVSLVPALAVGLAAGVGIALKPYFALLWLGLEAYLWAASRPRRLPLRAESMAVVGVGAAYLAAVMIWTPQYLEVVRRMAGPYHDFLSNPLWFVALLGDGAVIPLAAALAYLALHRLSRRPRLAAVLLVAALALYASAVLQHKGWRYHFYPSMAIGVVLLGILVADLRRRPDRLAGRAYRGMAAVLLAGTAAWTGIGAVVQSVDPLNPRYDADPDVGRLIRVVRDGASRGSVMVFSWSIASAYPLVNYSGVESASRLNSMWILGAVYRDRIMAEAPMEYREPGRMGVLERYLTDTVVEDLAHRRPRMLIVLRPAPDRREWGLRRLDFIAYYMRDTRFARLFSRYRFAAETGQYWIFERLPDDAPPAAPWRPAGQPPA
jgi:hypothetical protein